MAAQPMPGQWMVNVGGAQHGPYDDAVFRRMFAEGKVPANAMVWQVGMANWVPASQAIGVAPTFGVAAAPRPEKSRGLAAVIAFFLPGIHRAYLGKNVGAGVAFWAIYVLVSIVVGIADIFLSGGLVTLFCCTPVGLLVNIACVIDALNVKLD